MSRLFILCPLYLLIAACPLLTSIATAGCIVPATEADVFDESRSVAEVEVVSLAPFLAADQSIRTRLNLRIIERFKGDAPDQVDITTAGGTWGDRTDFRSDSLPLKVGKTYVVMLSRSADGIWSAHPQHAFRSQAGRREVKDFFRSQARGPRPSLVSASASETKTETAQGNAGIAGTNLTTTGYIETNNQPTRFTTCDGGEPIPYLIDVDPTKLPIGMNQAGAVAAVAEALGAWAASSSLKFRYEGLQSFGASASTIAVSDRRLRIQLHDNYNAITTSGVLGIGGGSYYSNASIVTGGNLAGQPFQERLYGYVVLESTASYMQNANVANFKRVLAHEVGHALGLAHSSETSNEPDAALKKATMFYAAENNSTGATIQSYDVGRIQLGYPPSNTPPYATDRIIHCVTTHPYYGSLPAGTPGVNLIQLRAMDQQGTPLTASMVSSTSTSGSFSFSGNILTYTPADYFGGGRATDSQLEAGYFQDVAYVHFSDGIHLSRAVRCSVSGFEIDNTPSDGLPDAWMETRFGTSAVGAVGSGRHPDDDPDRDGLSNRVEWYLNTDPNSAASGPVKLIYDHATRRISYTPVRFAPYWIESSTSLSNGSWSLRRVGTLYQSSGTLSSDFSGDAMVQKQFYRVVTGP